MGAGLVLVAVLAAGEVVAGEEVPLGGRLEAEGAEVLVAVVAEVVLMGTVVLGQTIPCHWGVSTTRQKIPRFLWVASLSMPLRMMSRNISQEWEKQWQYVY